MSDTSYQEILSKFEEKIRHHEEEARRAKRTVNDICRMAGQPERYNDAELEQGDPAGTKQFRSDEFYGKPLNWSVRRYLSSRQARNLGPASVAEIYESLKTHGYQFEAKTAENAKRGLRISLGKSSHTFHKLPNGLYGLLDWYPELKDSGTEKARGDVGDVKNGGSDEGKEDAEKEKE